MKKETWNPIIVRKKDNKLPVQISEFFIEILKLFENDERVKLTSDWRKIKQQNSEVSIFSSTQSKKIAVPQKISFGNIYYTEVSNKGKSFLKDLRNAFAHNYIEVDEDSIVRIALPSRYKKKVKLACYLSFDDLKEIVTSLIPDSHENDK